MIKSNLEQIFNEVKGGNNLGEPITVVGATKFQPVELINEAIKCGLKDIGENRAQEFRDKFDSVLPVNYHFFGSLQKNKVKYLIGKSYLIQSVDSLDLIEEINRQSLNKQVVTNILLEVNLGEEQKGGLSFSLVKEVLQKIYNYPSVSVLGLMAMLPDTDNEEILVSLLDNLRAFYDELKLLYNFKYLSVGMSSDYLLAIKHGSNMVRIGTKIFGRRY
ncbi:MAG: YggS family pyridoxal phosphate-dependent enzyme [Clostridia bacterium]|nr:YggS family pyridoxal phosphate-dependent enzyme [Clostridia bacterium]